MNIPTNERLDIVNENLSLIQRTDGLNFGTDALLLSAYINKIDGKGLEIGGGTGIITMLLLTREKIKSADIVEIQNEYAELIDRNARLNSLSDRISTVCADIRDFTSASTYDIVYSNPPYMKITSGKRNINDEKNTARHEVFGDIFDFCKAGKKLTRYGGVFTVVYRPDRLPDLIHAMKENILEPKRITFVHADTDSEASIVLVEARRGGGVGTYTTRPLFIYKDTSHKEKSEDMKYIENYGCFPEIFSKRGRK